MLITELEIVVSFPYPSEVLFRMNRNWFEMIRFFPSKERKLWRLLKLRFQFLLSGKHVTIFFVFLCPTTDPFTNSFNKRKIGTKTKFAYHGASYIKYFTLSNLIFCSIHHSEFWDEHNSGEKHSTPGGPAKSQMMGRRVMCDVWKTRAKEDL